MSVTDIHKDHEAKTMTITAEFDAPVERAWQLWADPRQLEQWWGPPTYPATVLEHDLTVGGIVKYLMTGPEGDTPRGYWRVRSVSSEAPHRLEFEDGFSDDAGEPNPDLPTTTIRVALDERAGGGTRMQMVTTFPSTEAMQQMIEMGMEEGITGAMAQIDGILSSDVPS